MKKRNKKIEWDKTNIGMEEEKKRKDKEDKSLLIHCARSVIAPRSTISGLFSLRN